MPVTLAASTQNAHMPPPLPGARKVVDVVTPPPLPSMRVAKGSALHAERLEEDEWELRVADTKARIHA